MAEKINITFCGMRLAGNEKIIGLVWEENIDELVLQFYHMNENKRYVNDELERIPIDSICTGTKVQNALSYLRRIAQAKKTSYNIYIEEDCYKAILLAYEAMSYLA